VKGKLDEGDPPGGGRVAVVGLGNVLMGDDGFGPFVVQQLLARFEFPDRVTVTDLGTPGLDLIPFIDGAAVLVVVDTVALDEPPGAVRVFRGEELRAAPRSARLSPHDPGLLEALDMLELGGEGPREVVLVGVVPQRCGVGPGLSEVARGAVDEAMAAVVEHLGSLGVKVKRREEPLAADIWWEDPVTFRGRQT
jgi:hydrogenase maturation protease